MTEAVVSYSPAEQRHSPDTAPRHIADEIEIKVNAALSDNNDAESH